MWSVTLISLIIALHGVLSGMMRIPEAPPKRPFCICSYLSAVYVQLSPTYGMQFSQFQEIMCPGSPVVMGTMKILYAPTMPILQVFIAEILDFDSAVSVM